MITAPSPPVREVRDERDLVQVAPAPRLARLGRAHDRVVRLVEVRRGVAVRRVVAAADLAALPAQPQVNPRRADLQALLATLDPFRQFVLDGVEVGARGHPRKRYSSRRAGLAGVGEHPSGRPSGPCMLRNTWRSQERRLAPTAPRPSGSAGRPSLRSTTSRPSSLPW